MPALSSASQVDLEQETLLRIHRGRLARRDPEERGVEASHVLDEAAPARATAARRVGPDRSRRRRPTVAGHLGRSRRPRRAAGDQNAAGSSAPPGKRQPMPTTAMRLGARALELVDARAHLAQLDEGPLDGGGARARSSRLPFRSSSAASSCSSKASASSSLSRRDRHSPCAQRPARVPRPRRPPRAGRARPR